jgi:hypothetical protein
LRYLQLGAARQRQSYLAPLMVLSGRSGLSIQECIVSILIAAVLAIFAVVCATVASTIVGTIALVNLVGINYEVAGNGCFWAGLIVSAGILVFAAFAGLAAVMSAGWLILGISLFFILAWLLVVFLIPR